MSCRHGVYQRNVGDGLQGLVVAACVLRAVKNVDHGWSVRRKNSWEDVTVKCQQVTKGGPLSQSSQENVE